MNGLDPAGMHEMRAMIASLVDEGRTVVLSSHLLDEIERTCDAVAIVDHGRVIRQGPIDELIHGAGTTVVQVDCSESDRAAQLINDTGLAAGVALSGNGLNLTLIGERAARSSPTSTAAWSRPGSTCIASAKSRRRWRTGSCPSRADWGNPRDRHRACAVRARIRAQPIPARQTQH